MKKYIFPFICFVTALVAIGFARAGTVTTLPATVSTSSENTFTADQNFTNISASGTITTNGFRMPIGASNGFVLTSSADGTATWQAASGGSGGSGSSAVPVGGAKDCGLSISGTTLSIGKIFSDSCVVGVVSSVSGEGTTAVFSSAVTVTFGEASQTDANLFGIVMTSGAWTEQMPLFLGVISDPTTTGTNHKFVLSRLPFTASRGSVASLCQLTEESCDAQDDVMILTTGLTLSNWISSPITQVAWMQGTLSVEERWTFSFNENSGFNHKYPSVNWVFPVNMNGAIEDTHLSVSGGDLSGDVPTWATAANVNYAYKVTSDGYMKLHFDTRAAGSATNGDTAGGLKMVLPFEFFNEQESSIYIHGLFARHANTLEIGMILPDNNSTLVEVMDMDGANITANGFSVAGDDLILDKALRIF